MLRDLRFRVVPEDSDFVGWNPVPSCESFVYVCVYVYEVLNNLH
jgi:hypothetical protein